MNEFKHTVEPFQGRWYDPDHGYRYFDVTQEHIDLAARYVGWQRLGNSRERRSMWLITPVAGGTTSVRMTPPVGRAWEAITAQHQAWVRENPPSLRDLSVEHVMLRGTPEGTPIPVPLTALQEKQRLEDARIAYQKVCEGLSSAQRHALSHGYNTRTKRRRY